MCFGRSWDEIPYVRRQCTMFMIDEMVLYAESKELRTASFVFTFLFFQNTVPLQSSLVNTKAHTSAISKPLATLIFHPPPRT